MGRAGPQSRLADLPIAAEAMRKPYDKASVDEPLLLIYKTCPEAGHSNMCDAFRDALVRRRRRLADPLPERELITPPAGRRPLRVGGKAARPRVPRRPRGPRRRYRAFTIVRTSSSTSTWPIPTRCPPNFTLDPHTSA